MFPVAWAVVRAENKDTWLWFLKLLKSDLELENEKGFTIISDRQKGLIWAVQQELPDAEHRMCARHIYGNLRRVYPGKALPKKLFWAIAKAYNGGEYKVALDALKTFDSGVYDAVLLKNPENCSRAYFSYDAVCEDVSNNFSESYNNSINKARDMPLIEMLETIRRQAMTRMDIRRKKAMKHQGKYSLKVGNAIKAEEKFKQNCKVHPSGNGQYEVSENGGGVTVDMNARFCACRRWSMTGIPCRHALRVIVYKKLKKEDYVSHWYLTSTWRSQYSALIRPVNGINFWRTSGEPTIKPPQREVTQGPTKKQKRIKGLNESPQKKGKGKVEPAEKKTKLPRQLGPIRCGRCSLFGHNSRGCRNGGVPNYKPPTKSKKSKAGEGSSTQPSQNSCVE